jgi:hypothetical protein
MKFVDPDAVCFMSCMNFLYDEAYQNELRAIFDMRPEGLDSVVE